MAKTSSSFICQQCGYESPRWLGKCPECGEWNSLVETFLRKDATDGQAVGDRLKGRKPVNLSSISAKKTSRISTKISELDRVLGGGIVPGQAILIAGEPGIGKSTILLQLAEKMGNVVYNSGEESVSQIKVRADRLGVKSKTIQVMEETDVDSVIQLVSSQLSAVSSRISDRPKTDDRRPTTEARKTDLVIIDSIQTMSTSDLSGMAGSVGQVKECTYRLIRLAKGENIPVFIVGHVTKQGSVAGPSVLMHLVDTVLWFEGDRNHNLRILRAVKNRFGPTDEVGIFSMEDQGLTQVINPEKIFISDNRKNIPGHVIASIMKGTRPILVEIQSLVTPSKMAFPKRISQGIDFKRFEMLLAVLIQRARIPLYEYDCYINVAGGIELKKDPSADLAVCISLASAFLNKPVAARLAIGEIGLLGDIREVTAQEKRVKEARRLGYTSVVTSREVRYLQEAIKKYLR